MFYNYEMHFTTELYRGVCKLKINPHIRLHKNLDTLMYTDGNCCKSVFLSELNFSLICSAFILFNFMSRSSLTNQFHFNCFMFNYCINSFFCVSSKIKCYPPPPFLIISISAKFPIQLRKVFSFNVILFVCTNIFLLYILSRTNLKEKYVHIMNRIFLH